jgi:hypothetical protein
MKRTAEAIKFATNNKECFWTDEMENYFLNSLIKNYDSDALQEFTEYIFKYNIEYVLYIDEVFDFIIDKVNWTKILEEYFEVSKFAGEEKRLPIFFREDENKLQRIKPLVEWKKLKYIYDNEIEILKDVIDYRATLLESEIVELYYYISNYGEFIENETLQEITELCLEGYIDDIETFNDIVETLKTDYKDVPNMIDAIEWVEIKLLGKSI